MGNAEKLLSQIMELKFTTRSLQRRAKNCENDEKSEKLKLKKAMAKGNTDGARIYVENAIRKRTEQMNYLRLASWLDTQAKMSLIRRSMGSIVKSLESTLATGSLKKMADDYGLEVSVGLPQAVGHVVPARETEKFYEIDLSRRLAELKARG